MNPENDKAAKTFGMLIADIARMGRDLHEERLGAAARDITPGEARALVFIAAYEGERQNRIARRMNVEPMTACEYVDRLERRGLVERQPDPDDRRAKRVVTTAEAAGLVEVIRRESDILREELLTGLSEDERAVLHRSLNRIHDNLVALKNRQNGKETPE